MVIENTVLAIFDPRSSIVKCVFDSHLYDVLTHSGKCKLFSFSFNFIGMYFYFGCVCYLPEFANNNSNNNNC